jgi:membrane protein YdbS with pleckstrin-like domain
MTLGIYLAIAFVFAVVALCVEPDPPSYVFVLALIWPLSLLVLAFIIPVVLTADFIRKKLLGEKQ